MGARLDVYLRRLRSVLDACADPIRLTDSREASAVTFPKAGNVKAPLWLVYAISEARQT